MLPNLIDRKGEDIVLSRPSTVAPRFVRGVAQPGTPTKVKIRAHVQPTSARKLDALGRGEIFREPVSLFTRGRPEERDEFTRKGRKYRVEAIEEYEKVVEAIASRIDP